MFKYIMCFLIFLDDLHECEDHRTHFISHLKRIYPIELVSFSDDNVGGIMRILDKIENSSSVEAPERHRRTLLVDISSHAVYSRTRETENEIDTSRDMDPVQTSGNVQHSSPLRGQGHLENERREKRATGIGVANKTHSKENVYKQEGDTDYTSKVNSSMATASNSSHPHHPHGDENNNERVQKHSNAKLLHKISHGLHIASICILGLFMLEVSERFITISSSKYHPKIN